MKYCDECKVTHSPVVHKIMDTIPEWLARIEERSPDLYTMLRKILWGQEVDPDPYPCYYECASCGSREGHPDSPMFGHHDDCEAAALLDEIGEKPDV